MELGMIGLGRMGGNMVLRLIAAAQATENGAPAHSS
jgi:6-phosphogluconate dehydrogenase (decarboxylating)